MSKAKIFQLPIENSTRISELMEIVNEYYPESRSDPDYIETCWEEAQDLEMEKRYFKEIGGVQVQS